MSEYRFIGDDDPHCEACNNTPIDGEERDRMIVGGKCDRCATPPPADDAPETMPNSMTCPACGKHMMSICDDTHRWFECAMTGVEPHPGCGHESRKWEYAQEPGDRLAEIRANMEDGESAVCWAEVDWLISEVERLRQERDALAAQVAKLEMRLKVADARNIRYEYERENSAMLRNALLRHAPADVCAEVNRKLHRNNTELDKVALEWVSERQKLRKQVTAARKALEHIAEHNYAPEDRPDLLEQPTKHELSWKLEGMTTLAQLAKHVLAALDGEQDDSCKDSSLLNWGAHLLDGEPDA